MYTTYKPVVISGLDQAVGTGWLPPIPDLRDYTDEKPEIAAMAKKLGLPRSENLRAMPETVDLRAWCSTRAMAGCRMTTC